MKAAIAAILAAATLFTSTPSAAQDNWVASWTASPHAPLTTEGPFGAPSYENVTISQVLRLSEGGERLRVRLSNRYGDRPLTIGEARIVLLDADGAPVPGTSRRLTFGGEASAVIPRGAPFTSDMVGLPTSDFDRVRVDIYLPQATGPCTCHLTGLDRLAVSAPGNHIGTDWESASTAQHRAFVSVVEVDSSDARGTVVAYGDSITDGVGSTPGANRRWPDVLAERLQAAGMEFAVANAGISGNRVLSPGMGESALARFDEDVLSLPGVTHVIVFMGVNDIGNRYGRMAGMPPGFPQFDQPEIDAAQMIAGYRQLIARAHAPRGSASSAPPSPRTRARCTGARKAKRRGWRSTSGSSPAASLTGWCGSTPPLPIPLIPPPCATAITWVISSTAPTQACAPWAKASTCRCSPSSSARGPV